MAAKPSKPKASKRSCCLVYGEKVDFLQKLMKDLCGDNATVDETQVVIFDGTVVTVYTCEIEIDSKYHFIRLRVIASDNIQALLDDHSIKTAYQLPSDGDIPPICSFIVACHTKDISESDVSKAQQCVQSLSTKWAPEGRILLGIPSFNGVESASIQKKTDLAKWCVKNQVELVDMECSTEECESFCEDGRETEEYGVKRIMSALTVAAAFVEEKQKRSSSPKFQRLSSSSGSSASSLNTEKKEDKDDKEDDKEASNEQAATASEAVSKQKTMEDADNFDALFSRLVSMKEKCQGLPEGDERHTYAEKVVTAFWKAIGGDDAELDDSSSNSGKSSSAASISDIEDGEGGAENLVSNNDNDD